MDNFYSGKRVLITGHTGFKGSWLAIWLNWLGAEVVGFALDPYSERDNFVLSGIGSRIVDLRGDICDGEAVEEVFQKYQPEIVFHLAAQPLVRLSYSEPVETYRTNVMGSINIMESFRRCESARVAVMITTDKCYENREQIWGYREDEAMGGYDPYSSSKGACEIAISSWRRSFMNPAEFAKHGKSIASVRAGNVIGGGDWSLDRIIPDCMRAIERGEDIEIRSPRSVRPWQHVIEPLSGYMRLAEKMWDAPTEYCEAWNFGPNSEQVKTVMDIAQLVVEKYGRGGVKDVSTSEALHEANLLMLDISKARYRLGWQPRMNADQTIEMTVDWYRRYKEESVYDVCVEHLKRYMSL
ncbi:MAG: CDP-glucose 4,6-dehydratase [Rikenellaceae bacterium]